MSRPPLPLLAAALATAIMLSMGLIASQAADDFHGGNLVSQWSKFGQGHVLCLNTEHPVFRGLPDSMAFSDESYWKLQSKPGVEVIAAVTPPAVAEPISNRTPPSFASILAHPKTRGDAFWTYEHYTYTFHDPRYRVLMVRCIAWALGESPAPFQSLVFAGLETDAGLFGTTDAMLNYTNRGR